MKLEDLKKQADELGLSYHPNIGLAKLQARIDEHTNDSTAKGSSVEKPSEPEKLQELQESVQTIEQTEPTNPLQRYVHMQEDVYQEALESADAKRSAPIRALARKLRKKAEETLLVTIVDNHPVHNLEASTCTVNCSNEFFDLGTVVIPLNEKVEIYRGHYDVLRTVEFQHHVKDKLPLGGGAAIDTSSSVMRPRYHVLVH